MKTYIGLVIKNSLFIIFVLKTRIQLGSNTTLPYFVVVKNNVKRFYQDEL